MSVSFDLIAEAARVLRPAVVETPLLESPALNALAGCRVLVKAENLQRTGSFKYRGAFFRLSKLTEAERKCGVIAFSSGNFAQALAAAGATAGVAVTIVMPIDAPKAKIDATRGYGAEIVLSEHGARATARRRPMNSPPRSPRLADSPGSTRSMIRSSSRARRRAASRSRARPSSAAPCSMRWWFPSAAAA